MTTRKLRILFDTSALNGLADDAESQALVAGVSVGYHVLLSETNINEIGATSTAAKRETLLKLCQRLVHEGEGIQPYHWILNALAHHHSADPEGFDWKQVDIRFRELEEEIARRVFLGNDCVADELRSDNKLTNKEFKELFRKARSMLSPLPVDGSSVTEVLDLLTVDESPLWRLAEDLYRFGAGQVTPAIRAFVGRCPPVSAALFGMCVGLYHWGAKREKEESLYGAGALDLFMAAYLPYCDRFVTRDDPQYATLCLVAKRVGLSTEVWTYSAFREALLV